MAFKTKFNVLDNNKKNNFKAIQKVATIVPELFWHRQTNFKNPKILGNYILKIHVFSKW